MKEKLKLYKDELDEALSQFVTEQAELTVNFNATSAAINAETLERLYELVPIAADQKLFSLNRSEVSIGDIADIRYERYISKDVPEFDLTQFRTHYSNSGYGFSTNKLITNPQDVTDIQGIIKNLSHAVLVAEILAAIQTVGEPFFKVLFDNYAKFCVLNTDYFVARAKVHNSMKSYINNILRSHGIELFAFGDALSGIIEPKYVKRQYLSPKFVKFSKNNALLIYVTPDDATITKNGKITIDELYGALTNYLFNTLYVKESY